jgi:hypothetical protein
MALLSTHRDEDVSWRARLERQRFAGHRGRTLEIGIELVPRLGRFVEMRGRRQPVLAHGQRANSPIGDSVDATLSFLRNYLL